jgi:tetratricopeptide (TPR) repeat protein
VSKLLSALLSVFVSTNQPAALSNLVEQTTGASVEVVNPNDPVDVEYHRIMMEDDKAHAEIDKWIRDAQSFEEKGVGSLDVTLNQRIEDRRKEIKKLYEDFLEKNPKHSRARIAYGSFLNDLHDEAGAAEQWEKAREIDPSNPAVWNNLANYYGHRSPVTKAFEYYEKAIELKPTESLYYWNFATTVYLFRQDAITHYKITEAEVFDKALGLYREALKRDPGNFVLASDYAQSFYGTKPPRYEEGLKAWEETFPLARDGIERDGVAIHLARCKIHLGRFDEAKADLNTITNEMYLGLKKKLLENTEKAEAEKPAPSL